MKNLNWEVLKDFYHDNFFYVYQYERYQILKLYIMTINYNILSEQRRVIVNS